MTEKLEVDPEGCPLCKGTGKILLLEFFEDCNECIARRDRRQKKVDELRTEAEFNSKRNDDDDGA